MWLWQTARLLTLAGELALCAPVGYLAVVAVSALSRTRALARQRRADQYRAAPVATTRFAIVIPAHDEELVIGTLLKSIQALNYPRDLFDVVVVADNCTDDTVAIVERSDVAHAYVRKDDKHRGKGYALAWAFERLMRDARVYDAFVVIDADSVVDPDLLQAFARGLRSGASAIQASYMVLNAFESPSTVLRWIALALVNHVRPLGRTGIGGSSTLPGNGMCFSRELLLRQPWTAFGLTEDYEYYLTITLAGEVVRFEPDAVVRALMPTTFGDMRSQDLRWESSSQGLSTREWAVRLLSAGLRQRDWRRIEATLELLTPPLSQLVALVALVALAALLLRGWPQLALAALLIAGMSCYVGSAFWLLKPPATAYRALLAAPGFVVWKLWVSLVAGRKHNRQGAWIRTVRARSARP